MPNVSKGTVRPVSGSAALGRATAPGQLARSGSESYLHRLADADRSRARQVRELIVLVREYGPDAEATAVSQPDAAGAIGADFATGIRAKSNCSDCDRTPVACRPMRSETTTSGQT